MVRSLVLTLFFISGALGLVYEVIWARELSLIFGITVFAGSTVLAAYMGGLAIGSYWIGRNIDKSANPVRVYAWLEIGVGVAALLLPIALRIVREVYLATAESLEDNFLLFNLVRAVLAGGVLLVPTTLMGGTVPAIGRFLTKQRETVGWNVGLLYAINTFGAVIGVVAAGFYLLPELGLSTTTYLAVFGNVAIGVLLLGLKIGDSPQDAAPETEPEPAPELAASSPGRRAVWIAGTVFAVSGFTALAYEVVWTRVLVIYVHNSSYAFSIMLAVFLAGLALGDALLIRFYDRIQRPILWLAGVQIAIGLAGVAAFAIYRPLQGLSLGIVGIETASDWGDAVTLMFVRAALVLLPISILFGMVFPLVARVVCRDMSKIGKSLGGIYAANTFGAIAGAIGGAFVLIPLFGLRDAVLILSGINIVLAATCWLPELRGVSSRAGMAVLSAALVIAPWMLVPKAIFFDALEEKRTLVYYHEGITDTTGVWELPDGGRIITYGDRRGTAGTMTNEVNRAQGHLAHLLHPEPVHSLQIGFGVGNTLASAELHPEVVQLDCVELSPHVRETAPFFWTNQGVLDKPKVNLIIDDGRNYIFRTNKKYDVITLEPPEMFTAAVVNLYTVEFYELAYEALEDDGLIVQWIAAGEMWDEEIQRLVRAMAEVFPDTTLWNAYNSFPGLLLYIGSKKPLSIDVEAMAKRMQHPALADDLKAIGMETPAKLLSLFIANDETIRRWTEGVPPVTDDHTVVDYAGAKSVLSGYGLGTARLQGDERMQFTLRRIALGRLYQELRDPVAPLLSDLAGQTRLLADVDWIRADEDLWLDKAERDTRAAAPEHLLESE